MAGAIKPFAARLYETLWVPIGVPGQLLLLLDAWLLDHWWPREATGGWYVAVPVVGFWLLAMAIVHMAARGVDVLTRIRASAVEDVARPAAFGLGVTAVFVAIGYGLSAFRPGSEKAMVAVVALASPVVFLQLATEPAAVFSPAALARTARAIGVGDWLLAFVSGLVLFGFSFTLLRLSVWGEREGIVVFPAVCEEIAAYALFLFPRMNGLLLNVHGEKLGYAFHASREVLAAPGARARGKPKPAVIAPVQTPVRRAPIDLNEGPSVADLVDAVRGGDWTRALALYGRWSRPPPEVDPSIHLAVGEAAAQQGSLAIAVAALKHAATARPDDPVAPRACLSLARLYADRMGDASAAAKLFRFVASRYAADPAAEIARRWLSENGGAA